MSSDVAQGMLYIYSIIHLFIKQSQILFYILLVLGKFVLKQVFNEQNFIP